MKDYIKSYKFLATLTFIGGFIDVYTFITRGGVFANTQTTNLARLGYVVASNQLSESIQYILPILACIMGGLVSTIFVGRRKDDLLHKNLLLFEVLILIVIGFVMDEKYDLIVNAILSFITSFQLNTFRKYGNLAHNTTISTGNLRQVGELMANYLTSRGEIEKKMFLKYTSLVFMFLIGAIVSVILTNLFMEKSIWVCGGIIIVLIMVGTSIGNKEKKLAYEH